MVESHHVSGGNQTWSSGRTISAFNHWAISAVPWPTFYSLLIWIDQEADSTLGCLLLLLFYKVCLAGMQGHTADDGETKNRTKGIRFFVDISEKREVEKEQQTVNFQAKPEQREFLWSWWVLRRQWKELWDTAKRKQRCTRKDRVGMGSGAWV